MLDYGEEGGGFATVPIPHLARGGRWRVEAMRSYSHARLIWFTRGQGRITVAGVTRGYGPNNAVFLPAGTMHGFELNPQVFGTVIDFPAALSAEMPTSPIHLRVRDAVHQGEFSAHLESFQRELSGDKPGRHLALESYARLMMIWLERQVSLGSTDTAPDDAAKRLANKFTDLVERDLSAKKTVSEFAHELGVTPTHLSRVCNAAAGRSAHDLMTDRLLAEANRLLADTDTPIRNIAADLGFSSAAYFSRAFQKKAGKSPSHFRANS